MLLIEGAKVVDVQRGVAEPGDWAVLDSGLLVKADDRRAVANPDLCERIAADGLYLVPGLIDAHVHLGRPLPRSVEDDPSLVSEQIARVSAQTIRGGVTLVRDLGDRWPRGLALVKAARQLGAPRVVSALSGLTVPHGYGLFLGEAVRDAEELVAAIRRRHQAGASVIKLFLTGGVDFALGTVGPSQFDRQTLALAADTAHQLGLPLAVHANGSAAVLDAALAGADTIEHGILVDDGVLRAMADCGVAWIPTLTPLWRALRAGGSPSADGSAALIASLRRVFEQHQASVAKAFDLGIKVVAGTDAGSPGVPHGCLAGEVALFVAAGVHPVLALKSATIWAAEALGVGHETGLVSPDRRADFLLLRRDPLQDAAVLQEITHVVCGGKVTGTLPGGAIKPERGG